MKAKKMVALMLGVTMLAAAVTGYLVSKKLNPSVPLQTAAVREQVMPQEPVRRAAPHPTVP